MATVVHLSSGKQVQLLPHHSFGRSEGAVNTFVPFPEVSKIHALLKWKDNAWYIEDVSTNGTQLNGRYLEKARLERLEQGANIQFAGVDGASWEVVDVSAPESQLISISDPLKTIHLDVYNLLPNEDEPECIIQLDTQKNIYRLQNLNDDGNGQGRVLKHGEQLLIGGELWVCFLPKLEEQTLLVTKIDLKLASLSVLIGVSQDEESITMKVHGAGIEKDFGIKAHHYLVCHLARQKLSDASKGLAASEQGWVHNAVLCAELGMEETHLNVQIYRIRNQINKALKQVSDVSDFIQRRSGAIRLGIDASGLSVNKGAPQPYTDSLVSP